MRVGYSPIWNWAHPICRRAYIYKSKRARERERKNEWEEPREARERLYIYIYIYLCCIHSNVSYRAESHTCSFFPRRDRSPCAPRRSLSLWAHVYTHRPSLYREAPLCHHLSLFCPLSHSCVCAALYWPFSLNIYTTIYCTCIHHMRACVRSPFFLTMMSVSNGQRSRAIFHLFSHFFFIIVLVPFSYKWKTAPQFN